MHDDGLTFRESRGGVEICAGLFVGPPSCGSRWHRDDPSARPSDGRHQRVEARRRRRIARVRAVLRRGGDAGIDDGPPGVLTAGPVRMDVERHVVNVDGRDVALPLKEFDLLEYLLRNVGRVLTRGQLIDRVWGADYVGDTKTLDVHVKRLRAKIETDPGAPKHLVTVRGLGYKFDA
jgi:transcriptional regulator